MKKQEPNVPSEPLEALDDEKALVKALRFQRIVNINMVRIFFVALISVSLIALIPSVRPSYSVTEKRELHRFPDFSFRSLFSGSYFDDIGLWYSDTFPLRDSFVSINSKLTNLFGIKSVEIHGDVIKANAVPDSEAIDNPSPDTEAVNPEPVPETIIEKIGAMAIIGDTGYEYYNFDKGIADSYISSINRAGELLSGKCRVFNMVVPTSIAVTLDEQVAAKMDSSDQKAAIDYIYTNISDNTVCVDCYNTLKKHKNEYIYFRTDHHWTALGAYYSYVNLMKSAGKTPADISVFKQFVFEGFLGTFYTTSGMSQKLSATPDTVYAYEPPGIEYIHTYEVGFEKDYHIVSNADKLSASEKYLTFICGDHPLGVITNEQITDNSACLVIKESFGNPLAAYLTQNYHTVYIADCRKIKAVYGGNLESFVAEHGISDVFFVNNISATRNRQIANCIADFIG